MSSNTSRGPRDLVLEAFDPGPSIEVALEVLEAAGVTYALAGRLAVWAWVAGDEQEFTKDVAFAVPAEDLPAVEEAARSAGYELLELPIGGCAIRDGSTRVDFIDRRVDFGDLFAASVRAARGEGGEPASMVETTGGRELPVVPPAYLIAMKLATGAPRDERDVERLLEAPDIDYDACRRVVRQFLGPAAANRLDHIGTRLGVAAAVRYVRETGHR